jgi:hypothetical protein
MTTSPECLWCGQAFTPRATGGKAQVFCRPDCRRGFDAAGRRWVAEAIAFGVLTVDALKNGPAATRALAPVSTSPMPVGGEGTPNRLGPTVFAVDNSYTPQEQLEAAMARAIAIRRR